MMERNDIIIGEKRYYIDNLQMSDIRHLYRSHRAEITVLNHRKTTTYRADIVTPLGQIPLEQWKQIATQLIQRDNETEIYEQLKQYVIDTCAYLRGTDHLEEYALELHTNRIFDNPAWVGFIPFNTAHRPAAIKDIELVLVTPPCCQKPGYVTKAQIDYGIPDSAYCPHCGRWFHL